MKKRTIWRAAAVTAIVLAYTWGVTDLTTGADFFDKAMEESQRKRQQQQQTGQPPQAKPPQQQSQSQPPSQSQQQPRYRPGGNAQLPNEKPQPSPDFGTPEGTAKIAAKAGLLDLVGIKLGMPVKEAVDALKAHNAGFKPAPNILYEYEALPGVVMTPELVAPNPAGPTASAGDYFNLFVTYAPNEAFLWGIVRNLGFGRQDNRPTVENTLAGLRKKYGPESTRQPGGERLIWIYDAQGQQVMGAKADDIYSKCSQTWAVNSGGESGGGNRPNANHELSNSIFDQQLKQGYYYGTGGYGSSGGMCHAHSVLDVYYLHATPAGSAAALMTSMTMGAFNRQLEASSVMASHTHLMDAVDKLNEKRGAEESKRGGMKF